MSGQGISIDICEHVWVSTTVTLKAKDLVAKLGRQDRDTLAAALFPGLRTPTQAEMDAVIERAFLVASGMPDLPAEIKDLFWLVHGRALP